MDKKIILFFSLQQTKRSLKNTNFVSNYLLTISITERSFNYTQIYKCTHMYNLTQYLHAFVGDQIVFYIKIQEHMLVVEKITQNSVAQIVHPVLLPVLVFIRVSFSGVPCFALIGQLPPSPGEAWVAEP